MLTFVKKRHWGERVGRGGEGAEIGRELLIRQKCFCVTVGRKCKGKQWPRLMQQNKGDTEERKEKIQGSLAWHFLLDFQRNIQATPSLLWRQSTVDEVRTRSGCWGHQVYVSGGGLWQGLCVCMYTCVCDCTCVWEREWERCLWCVCERDVYGVCVRERGFLHKKKHIRDFIWNNVLYCNYF